MNDTDGLMSIEDLAEAVGAPVRTIRYYIGERLLPGPGARGKSAAYGDEHLLRLRLIRRLVEQRLPLTDVRRMMDGLSLGEVRALLTEHEQRAQDLYAAAASASPATYVATLLDQARQNREQPRPRATGAASWPAQTIPPAGGVNQQLAARPLPLQQRRTSAPSWRRWEAAPGVEIHVREDILRQNTLLIDHILQAVDAALHGISGGRLE